MNTEDFAEAKSTTASSSVGVVEANTGALFKRLGVVTTTARAVLNDDSSATSPVADIALRRMSLQLAGSMGKLVDELNTLLNQLAHAEAAHAPEGDGIAPMAAEADQIRRQLVWGGYRLASELRRIARAQQSPDPHRHARTRTGRTLTRPRVATATVIDIQDILKSVSGKLQESQ